MSKKRYSILTNVKNFCIFYIMSNKFFVFGAAMTNRKDTLKDVIEKEYRVSVNNLSLAVFFLRAYDLGRRFTEKHRHPS